MLLEKSDLWPDLLNYCPELKFTKKPKDRCFFYNILNTISPKCVDKMVLNAMRNRQEKSKIENEISVIPFFRDIFTNDTSLLGNTGNVIKALRVDHKADRKSYTKRKRYNLSY